jgi:hypothetical protein
MEPVTVESIMESVEAFAEKSALAISAIAVGVRGIARVWEFYDTQGG